MSGIFISYRREDSAFVSGLIHERLAAHFGSDAIFTDVDSIPLGVNFKKYIDDQVGKCEIFLAVIGEKWVSVSDEGGRPRLENPEDFVRLEIESALRRDIPVIPLLVGNITMPSADKLPEPLRELAFHNGTPIRPMPDFDSDVERLIRGIDRDLENQAEAEEKRKVHDEQRRRAEEEARRKAEKEEQRRPKAQLEGGEEVTQAETKQREPTQGAARPGAEQEPSDVHLAKTPEPRKVSRRDFLGFEPRASTVRGGWKWLLVGVVLVVSAGGVWSYQGELKVAPGTVFRDTLTDGSPGPEMVVIPAGSFMMGSPESEEGRYTREDPQHPVTIDKFAMGKYEVTFEEYDEFAKATGRDRPEDRGWGRGNRPVINVSWDDAVAYVDWLAEQTGKRYRLPSEAEWEYAARAGTETAYWWGDDIGDNRANCGGCGSFSTAPVGSFEANSFGLFDTAGNVWEWLQDCYHKDYQGAPSDGTAWETGDCSRREVRGGSWDVRPVFMRSADRNWGTPDARFRDVGFRLAQDLD